MIYDILIWEHAYWFLKKKHWCERETSIGWPDLESNLQPRYFPWPRVKPATFWCMVPCSNWPNHLARATCSIFTDLKVFRTLPVHVLPRLFPQTVTIRDLFTGSVVLPFLECHVPWISMQPSQIPVFHLVIWSKIPLCLFMAWYLISF